MDHPLAIQQMNAVAQYLSGLIPANRVSNQAMADSQVNCSVVFTGLPWHSPETDCLRDILTLGGILVEVHYGVHYCQLGKGSDGRNTGTAFVGWVNRELAIACVTMYQGYHGPACTPITVTENESGNPLDRCDSRRVGNPRRDEDIWEFPDPRDNERMGQGGQLFGAPTFKYNWSTRIDAGTVRI